MSYQQLDLFQNQKYIFSQLAEELLKLCYLIEEIGPSTEQTNAIVAASELRSKILKLSESQNDPKS